LATSQLRQPTPGENIQQSSDLITRSAANQKRLPWANLSRGNVWDNAAKTERVVLMRPDRPKFASNNLMEATSEEIKAAFEGYVSYCGSYEVNEQERFVIRRLQMNWFSELGWNAAEAIL
jgi:Lipocalin-like domain